MMTVREIASLLDGDVVGNEALEIAGVAKIEEAKAGELTFLSNPKYEKFLESTKASTVIVSRSLDMSKHPKLPPSLIQVDDPYSSFVIAIQKFSPPPALLPPGIHTTAVVDPSAKIGKNLHDRGTCCRRKAMRNRRKHDNTSGRRYRGWCADRE